MPNMTFSLPDDLHREIRSHKDIKWAEVCRQAIERELERIHAYEQLLAHSALTEEDAVEIGRWVRRRTA